MSQRPGLPQRLASALTEVVSVDEESDGALTLTYHGTLASLRVVPIAEGLDLVALTQILGWDLPLTATLRKNVAAQATGALLGTVTMVEKAPEKPATTRRNSSKVADVMLRYNFPGNGLTDEALRTLVLLVLEKGAEIRRLLTAR